jgi:hypothetical protein
VEYLTVNGNVEYLTVGIVWEFIGWYGYVEHLSVDNVWVVYMYQSADIVW